MFGKSNINFFSFLSDDQTARKKKKEMIRVFLSIELSIQMSNSNFDFTLKVRGIRQYIL